MAGGGHGDTKLYFLGLEHLTKALLEEEAHGSEGTMCQGDTEVSHPFRHNKLGLVTLVTVSFAVHSTLFTQLKLIFNEGEFLMSLPPSYLLSLVSLYL